MRELSIRDLNIVYGGTEQVTLPDVVVTPKSEFVQNGESLGKFIGSSVGEFTGFFTGGALGALLTAGNPLGIIGGASGGALAGSNLGGELGQLVGGRSAEILESRDGNNYDGTNY